MCPKDKTMRKLLLLSLLLLPFGCGTAANSPADSELWQTVEVDQAAAYPSQEPGTQPPVLTGFARLSDEKLREGWICLFDGVSTYGWESEATLTVKKWDDRSTLLTAEENREFRAIHWLLNVDFISSTIDLTIESREGNDGWIVMEMPDKPGSAPGKISVSLREGCTKMDVKPTKMQALGPDAWKPAAEPVTAVWTEDGALELSGGSGMLESVGEYGDFVLQLEYFTESPVNSGVFFRCIPGEKMNGYECQIYNQPPADDYKKFIGTDTGGLFRRQVGRNVGAKDGEWNYLTIAAQDNRFATWVNGIQVTDWTDTRAENPNPRQGLRKAAGTLQLQGHDPATKIKFRNIRIAVP